MVCVCVCVVCVCLCVIVRIQTERLLRTLLDEHAARESHTHIYAFTRAFENMRERETHRRKREREIEELASSSSPSTFAAFESSQKSTFTNNNIIYFL